VPGFGYSQEMFSGLIEWSKERGFNTLKLGCKKRLERFFERRYGFTSCGDGEMERRI
jgi:N-acyl-L-homoserine lactone synthetase